MISKQLAEFKNRLELLKSIQGYSGVQFKIGNSSNRTKTDLTAISVTAGKKLHSNICDLYLETNGFAFKWEVNTSEQCFGGSLNIPSLEVLLGGFGNKETVYKAYSFKELFTNPEVNEIPIAKDLHLFDQDSFENYCVGIDLINNKLFLNLNFELFPLTIEIDNYFKLCLQSLGLSFWQFLYVQSNSYDVTIRKDSFVQRANELGLKI